ncbi:MAG: hypothetical protein H7Z12_04550 [Rhodospirillaceae bacterium]|nr:hypothetical protein [Rhodospirillales bacterium]
MTIRRAALALTIALVSAGASFSTEARAERLHTGGIPLSANNAVVGANIAAGIGNASNQQIMASQGGGQRMLGPGGHPLVATNTQIATNVAAGMGNTANQTGMVQQGGPMVGLGLDFSGRGPMVTSNVAVNTNVAAGLNNHASQGVLTQQR